MHEDRIRNQFFNNFRSFVAGTCSLISLIQKGKRLLYPFPGGSKRKGQPAGVVLGIITINNDLVSVGDRPIPLVQEGKCLFHPQA